MNNDNKFAHGFDAMGGELERSVDSKDAIREERKQLALEKLKTANLSDDIFFSIAMQNKEICCEVLTIILGKDIIDVDYVEVQKAFINSPLYKSTRLDVFAKDKSGNTYNVEMQKVNNDDMSRRARFYQGVIDSSGILRGTYTHYKDLADSYILFITEFDVFGGDLCRYTFRNRCDEDGRCLNDGTTKIFLNTVNVDKDTNVSDTLRKFLKYVHLSTEENASGDAKLKRLHNALNRFRVSDEGKGKIMGTDWIAYEAEQAGFKRGEERGEKRSILKAALNMKKAHQTDDYIMQSLMTLFDLSQAEARDYLSKINSSSSE